MQPASLDICKKYRLKTIDDIDGTYQRVAKALAEAEPTAELRSSTGTSASCGRCAAAPFRPAASPPMPARWSTSRRPATINCTVSGTIEDSMDGILEKVHEAGLTLKAGCGIGYEFSTLRPRGAFVAGAGAYTSARCPSWISTTRCASPCPRPVAAAARRWAPSTSRIRT
jgi:ribonucleoside-diphosphate reductase alpha chain